MNIGLLGYGTVGAGVDRIIKKRSDMRVTKVISLEVPDEIRTRISSIEDIVNDPSVDTVVEVMGGLHPAFDFVLRALQAGKNVVTANKAIVAAFGPELMEAAKEAGVSFRCTAAAGGSIPWLTSLERAGRVDEITEIGGILNGTTNYILDQMSRFGKSFPEVLAEAQRLGYAESDPSADIDGADIRRKICISAEVAFGAFIDEEKIPVFGIRNIREEDIEAASARSCAVKMVARAAKTPEGELSVYVEPAFVPGEELLAHVPANLNLIHYTGKYCGTQSFTGEGAGRFPTAYNVVQDIIDLLEAPKGSLRFYGEVLGQALPDNSKVLHPYYYRTSKGATVTEPMSVCAMHELAERLSEDDPEFFAAGLPQV